MTEFIINIIDKRILTDGAIVKDILDTLEISPFLFHSLDEDGLILKVSQGWLDATGYSLDDVIGKKGVELLTPDSASKATTETLPVLFETGRSENVYYQLIKKDGELMDVLISAIVYETDLGKCTLSITTDITEQKSGEKMLDRYRENLEDLVKERTEEFNDTLEMYKTLARISPVGIMRVNEFGACDFVNKKWCDMTGLTKKESSGSGWMSAIHPTDIEQVNDIWEEAVKHQKSWTREFKLCDIKGNSIWVQCSGNIVNNGNNGHVVTFTNVTKEKKILPELLSLNEMIKTETGNNKVRRRKNNGN